MFFVGVAWYLRNKQKKSPYFTIKSKLEEELVEAKFKSDWRKIQETNLFLLWLKVIAKVEKEAFSGAQKQEDEDSKLASLSEDEIKFPLNWDFESFYHFPLASEIISGYGKLLVENDYKVYKPEQILPFPKEIILKAIDFTLAYFNYDKPLYETSRKEEFADNIKATRFILVENFVDTTGINLPKDGIENFRVGKQIRDTHLSNGDE